MLYGGFVKSVSVTAMSLASLVVCTGVANAESVTTKSINNITEATNLLESSDGTNIEIINESSQLASQGDLHSTSATAVAAGDSSVPNMSVSSMKLSGQGEDRQNTSSGGVTNAVGEINASEENNTSVQNTTVFGSKNTELPLSTIASKIEDPQLSAQNTSSTLTLNPIPYAAPVAPVNPAIPVEPQSPVGFLQQLSLILAQSPAANLLAVVSYLEIHFPWFFAAIVILTLFAAAKPTSLFVQFLRQSGYSGAARSGIADAPIFFATPLKMSFIAVHLH